MKKVFVSVKSWLSDHKREVATFFIAFLHAFLMYYCLELGNKNPFMNGVFYTIINVISIFAIHSLIYLFTQRWWIASLIVSVPVTVLSIANYYTLLFRNAPISTQDLYNVGTAMGVMDGYSLHMSAWVVAIIVVASISLVLIPILYHREKGKKYVGKEILKRNVSLLLFFAFFFNFIYFGDHPIKPRSTFAWSWEDSYYAYGYAASSIEVFQNSMNVVSQPDNYSEETLEERVYSVVSKDKTEPGNQPDVILILNETFFDLRDVVDLGNTPSVMPFIDSLPDNIKGKALVPYTGGGTNKSEYELLSSNSLQLMQGITPFNYLEFDDADTVVSHMKSLGYSTWGAHCEDSLNYSRAKVYPKLGFDQVLFEEDFGEYDTYGDRPYPTDAYCYDRMISDYEKMGDGPRFMYMLTMQNHGNWELNAKKNDLVDVETDFGSDYNDRIDEYESCILKSDMAFKELLEYFETSERDVIICMVGDHSPAFAIEIMGEADRDETIAVRSTPYVIWSNYGLELDVPDHTCLPYLVPTVLEAAGIQQSPFYRYINEMRKKVPVISAFGVYKNAAGEFSNYDDDTPYTELVNTYMDLVYNNASSDANKIKDLFTIGK